MTLSAGPVTVVVTVDRERVREEWPFMVTTAMFAVSAILAGAIAAYLL